MNYQYLKDHGSEFEVFQADFYFWGCCLVWLFLTRSNSTSLKKVNRACPLLMMQCKRYILQQCLPEGLQNPLKQTKTQRRETCKWEWDEKKVSEDMAIQRSHMLRFLGEALTTFVCLDTFPLCIYNRLFSTKAWSGKYPLFPFKMQHFKSLYSLSGLTVSSAPFVKCSPPLLTNAQTFPAFIQILIKTIQSNENSPNEEYKPCTGTQFL